MAKSPRGLVIQSKDEEKKDEGSSLPIVELIGLSRVPRGYVVVAVTIQGDKILEKEVLSRDPEPKGIAAQKAMLEFAKTFVAPSGDTH
jgi:hypothetical protein